MTTTPTVHVRYTEVLATPAIVDDLTVLGWHYPLPRRMSLPLVTLTCDVCHTVVDFDTEAYCVSRVRGDSRYGYEPFHTTCLERFELDTPAIVASHAAQLAWTPGTDSCIGVLTTRSGRVLAENITSTNACRMFPGEAVTVKVPLP